MEGILRFVRFLRQWSVDRERKMASVSHFPRVSSSFSSSPSIFPIKQRTIPAKIGPLISHFSLQLAGQFKLVCVCCIVFVWFVRKLFVFGFWSECKFREIFVNCIEKWADTWNEWTLVPFLNYPMNILSVFWGDWVMCIITALILMFWILFRFFSGVQHKYRRNEKFLKSVIKCSAAEAGDVS